LAAMSSSSFCMFSGRKVLPALRENWSSFFSVLVIGTVDSSQSVSSGQGLAGSAPVWNGRGFLLAGATTSPVSFFSTCFWLFGLMMSELAPKPHTLRLSVRNDAPARIRNVLRLMFSSSIGLNSFRFIPCISVSRFRQAPRRSSSGCPSGGTELPAAGRRRWGAASPAPCLPG